MMGKCLVCMVVGWWKAEDIKGLTPLQIQDKFALQATPKSVVEVKLKAGDTIRMGDVKVKYQCYFQCISSNSYY